MIRFLKSVLKGVLIGLIIWFIKGYIVNAQSISDLTISLMTRYKINESNLSLIPYDEFRTALSGSYITFDVTGQIQPNQDLTSTNPNDPTFLQNLQLWGRFTICVDNPLSGGWESGNSSNVNFVNTMIPCRFTGSTLTGHITFATYQLTNLGLPVDGKIQFHSLIGTSFFYDTSWQVIAHELSFNQFPTYYIESYKFDKLDSIIEGINTLISNGNNASVVGAINSQTSSITTNAIQNTQNITNAQQDTTNAINDMNDTIKDDNVDSPQDYSSNVASNGVITQLITLPITLFQKILNSTSASCTPFQLGDLFGETLIMPCINLQNYLGNTLFNVIDILISGLFIYAISRKMVKVFNNLSSMKEGDVING